MAHLREDGTVHMVDVADKRVTTREATAIGLVSVPPHTVARLRNGEVDTTEMLATARVAGICGVKKTSELIPLAHVVNIHGADVELEITDEGILMQASVRANDLIGPEMEALTAVTVAGLTLVDMLKSIDRSAAMRDIMVVAKSGGRTGSWRRDLNDLPNWAFDD